MKLKLTKKKILIVVIILIILLIFINKISSSKDKNINIPVEIHKIEKGNINSYYEFSGTVNSDKEISVFTNTLAQVKKLNHRLGDNVKKGDVLIEFDETFLEENSANLEKLRLDYADKEKKYKAFKEIYELGGVSKFDLDNTKLAYEMANIDYHKAKTNYNKFEKNIYSPIDGVITEVNADVNYKVDSSKALFKIADTKNLKIEILVSNTRINNISLGQKVEIKSDSLGDKDIIIGKVTDISSVSYKNKNFGDATTKVDIQLEDAKALRPGETVVVKLYYSNVNDVVVIPFNYISKDMNGNPMVYIVKDDKVEARIVELGLNDDTNYEIKSGLSNGEEVLNNSSNSYKEGDKIIR